jgi:hypothetical protein
MEGWEVNASRILAVFCTGQFKKKVTHSHIYNDVTGEPTITRYITFVRKTLKVSRVNYKQTLRVFLTIDAYHMIVGSLVTSL